MIFLLLLADLFSGMLGDTYTPEGSDAKIIN